MRLHHVAYAVKTISKASDYFVALGYTLEGATTVDEKRDVIIQFMINEDGLRIELVEPLSDASPVSRLLHKEHGATSPYHMCYEVSDISAAIPFLVEKGFILSGVCDTAPAIGDSRVQFLFSKDAGLIELVEI